MILFLDIDGVLHPDPPQPDQRLRSLPRLVEILRDHPQVEVVISSLWREHLSLDQLRDLFPADLRERIIDVTPIAERIDGWLPARREGEILDWLEASGRDDEPWLAIDDQAWQFTQHRDRCRFQKATAPVHWAGRRVCIELLTGNGQKFYARSAARDRNCSELLCTARQSRNRRKFRRSTGKLLDALGQAAESLVHVFQHLGFCALRAQRVFEGFQVGQPLPMQAAQLVELRPEVLETAARTKRLVATLKRGRRGQQLRAHLLVLFGELGHAVIGPRSLAALGFGCLFHDAGVAVEPWELAGQRHELLIGCADPNPVQVRPVPHHAIDDGMGLADTLGGKLLHVLVDLRGQSAEFVHAHVRHKRRVDCPCAVRSATAFLSKETKVSPPSQLPS